MVSLTTTCSTPTVTTNTCAISLNAELLRALRATEHGKARLPQALSRVFAKAVEPMLEVHRSVQQQPWTPGSSATKPLASLTQASAAGGPEADRAEVLRQDVDRQVLFRSLPVDLDLAKVMVSSAPRTPNHVCSRSKDVKALMVVRQKEMKEHGNKEAKPREKAKVAVEK